MRYTEARMNKLSLEMVRDIDSDTVNFVDNYDGTLTEPEVLPSRFPNLLVNGSQGIAVGMATNMKSRAKMTAPTTRLSATRKLLAKPPRSIRL